MSANPTTPSNAIIRDQPFGIGLTKREYFAAMAMQAILTGTSLSLSQKVVAELSVENADALLEALEKSES